MSLRTSTFKLRMIFFAGLLLVSARASVAQTSNISFGECKINTAAAAKDEKPAAAAEQISALRIEVKGPDGKPVRSERFYLLTRGLKESGVPDPSTAPKRADFLKGASPELLALLNEYNCDTPYCPEIYNRRKTLKESVPEFRKAYETGLRRYKYNPRLAEEWMMVNFPLKNFRTQYYDSKHAWLEQAARRAGAVASVMTNDDGMAFFTRIKLGDYHVSNILPVHGSVVWDCAVTVLPNKKELHSVSVVMTAPKQASAGAGEK